MDQVLAAFDECFPARLEFLKTLVNQNSFTTNREGVHRVQSLLEDRFWALKMHTQRTTCPKRADILVAQTSGEVVNPVLLVGHADTVHPPQSSFKSWSIEGDVMRGPGVLDMKGGLIHIFLIIDILEKLGKLRELPLKVLINSAEENSTPMSAKLVQDIAKGAREAFVFEIGREDGGIVTQRKGITELWVESTGKAAHSGNAFYEGTNALVPLCDVALRSAALTNLQNEITVNIAQLHSGDHFCVVPANAKLGIEIRGGTAEGMADTVRTIREIVGGMPGMSMTIETDTAPLNKTSKTDELFKRFKEASDSVGFAIKELPRVGGLSDANLIGSLGIPTLDALGPYGTGAHTNDELIYISSVKERVSAVVAYLLAAY